ncbi:MAG: hypothetical protein LIP77_09260 [Planctomycetes bacterium]|nr:hypothetical protein [Planctomycetota bacterium]
MTADSARRLPASDTRPPTDGLLRPLAAVTALAAVICAAVFLFSRDVHWQRRQRAFSRQGRLAEDNGNYDIARHYYLMALANNPYDWQTHYTLATMLNHQVSDYQHAVRHYYYALAYASDPTVLDASRKEVELLQLVLSGELESPLDAMEDLFLAVEAGAPESFTARLSLRLRPDAAVYWQAWNRRGRGRVTHTHISGGRDGFFNARVDVDFPDGTSMSMHLLSPLHDLWRLDVSFP